MADIENQQQQEPVLATKRKPDLASLDGQERPSPKTLKLQSEHKDEAINGSDHNIRESCNDVGTSSEEPEETSVLKRNEFDDAGAGDPGDRNGEEKHEEQEDEGVAKVSAISRDDKGKGKLIVEDESEDDSDNEDDDDDDDSSYGGNETDGDSDLCEDPLTEVDLDNILPSRTRRRAVKPGVYISNEPGADDDGDSSDDSDA